MSPPLSGRHRGASGPRSAHALSLARAPGGSAPPLSGCPTYRPSSLLMIICWISDVPSVIEASLASRYRRSTGYSVM